MGPFRWRAVGGDAIRVVLLVCADDDFGAELEREGFEVSRISHLAALGPGSDRDAVIVTIDDPRSEPTASPRPSAALRLTAHASMARQPAVSSCADRSRRQPPRSASRGSSELRMGEAASGPRRSGARVQVDGTSRIVDRAARSCATSASPRCRPRRSGSSRWAPRARRTDTRSATSSASPRGP